MPADGDGLTAGLIEEAYDDLAKLEISIRRVGVVAARDIALEFSVPAEDSPNSRTAWII